MHPFDKAMATASNLYERFGETRCLDCKLDTLEDSAVFSQDICTCSLRYSPAHFLCIRKIHTPSFLLTLQSSTLQENMEPRMGRVINGVLPPRPVTVYIWGHSKGSIYIYIDIESYHEYYPTCYRVGAVPNLSHGLIS